MTFVAQQQENQILMLTLNRVDKRNAFHPPLMMELVSALQAASLNQQLKAVIIQGNGDHFCAGADIDHMRAVGNMSQTENQNDAALIAQMLQTIVQLPIPVMAVAHGATLGGGLGILAACDIAIATDTAQFGFSEIKLALAPSTISPYVMQAIGMRAAQYYFLTGERFNAQEALRLGLIHKIIAATERDTTIAFYQQHFQQLSQTAIIANKKLLQTVGKKIVPHETQQFTVEHLSTLRASKDAQEGLRAFLEKRQPQWQ